MIWVNWLDITRQTCLWAGELSHLVSVAMEMKTDKRV